MTLSHDDIHVMARAVGLHLPETDVGDVAARVNALLAAVADLEQAFGGTLGDWEPIPPVLPAKPFGSEGPHLGLEEVR